MRFTQVDVNGAGPWGDGVFLAGRAKGESGKGWESWLALVNASGSATVHLLGPGSILAGFSDEKLRIWLAGRATDANPLSGVPWVGRVSKDGKKEFAVTFKTDVDGTWYDLAPRPGGVLVAGMHNTSRPGEMQGWIAAVNEGGTIAWEHRIGQGRYHFLTSILSLPGGSLAVGGQRGGALDQPWFVRMDPAGKIAKSDLAPDLAKSSLTQSVADADGGVYLVGTRKDGARAAKGIVVRLAPDGATRWRQSFGEAVDAAGAPLLTSRGIVFLAIEQVSSEHGAFSLVAVSADGKRATSTALPSRGKELTLGANGGFLLPAAGALPERLRLLRVVNEDGRVEWLLEDVQSP